MKQCRGHEGYSSICRQHFLDGALELIVLKGWDGDHDQVGGAFRHQVPAQWTVYHRRRTSILIAKFKNGTADFRQAVIHKRHRLQSEFWRTPQNRVNTAPSGSRTVDQNALDAITLRVQLLDKHVNEMLLHKQEQRHKAQRDYHQPSGKQEAGEKAD